MNEPKCAVLTALENKKIAIFCDFRTLWSRLLSDDLTRWEWKTTQLQHRGKLFLEKKPREQRKLKPFKNKIQNRRV